MKLKIKNFMCHENLELDIENLNILSGENGSGKSAILHAIYWCLTGEGNYTTTGKKTCEVEIELGGLKVTRKIPSELWINGEKKSNLKTNLQDFIQHVPIEIHGQFSGIFLLKESPARRLELVNDILYINDIENALETITKDIKDLQKENTELNRSIEDNEDKLLKCNINEKDIEKVVDYYEIISKLNSYKEKTRLQRLSVGFKVELIQIVFKLVKWKEYKEKLNCSLSLPEHTAVSLLQQYLNLIIDINKQGKDWIKYKETLQNYKKELNGKGCPLCQQPLNF